MSRVFRRPMFRKGGNVGEGIMTGIRDNYENGGAAERITKAMQSVPTQSFDPLTQFLIQGGLNLASQPSTGGVLSDIATAAKEPTAQLFQGLSERDKLAREIAVAGAQLDIEQDLKLQEMQQQANLKLLEQQFKAAEGDRDRQNKIAVKIQEGKNALDELQFKLENPGVDSAKAGVIPSIITQQMDRQQSYAESSNLELKKSPDFHSRKTVNFERTAPPEILKNYKGVVYYGYGQKGGIDRVIPPGAGNAGDIIYDPQQSDFFIFDNQGNTYRYDPATNTAAE
jgi:hypothetical protein